MLGTSRKGLGETLTANPLHEQVGERIIERIVDGTWPEGFVLPPEQELARQLGVSEGTIRRAMQALTADGLLMRRRRTGTVVTGRAPCHSLEHYYRYYRLHSREGRLVQSQTRNLDLGRRPPTEAEIVRLKLPDASEVGTLTRIRLSEGRPVMIDRIVLPLHRLHSFPNDVAEMPPLIYKWLLDNHGLRLGALRETVTARLATDADRVLLELSEAPEALLDIDVTAYDQMNEPLLLMHHAALTSAHCLVNEVR
ncbi:MAG: GntR family transcriptional regulator [Pseudorhodobacter sp.]|jgi:GntR family transcriptional regulator